MMMMMRLNHYVYDNVEKSSKSLLSLSQKKEKKNVAYLRRFDEHISVRSQRLQIVQ